MVNLIAADSDGLEVVDSFPHETTVNPDLRIPLPDGAWLHARLWMPVDAALKPVPAVIEYAPFRHRDFTAPRDALIHPWFAGNGYASLRVELRGSGDSGGSPMDEYVAREQDDALVALEWIAAQGWCDGNTGLFGMSWGAFSALQVAARQPPSLKAIIPVHGTDDRFADDIHYKGGCLLTAGLSWGALYTLYMMRPPDPVISGPSWRETWLQRFDLAPMVLEPWMTHQQRDDYWVHGSVSEDYSRIICPALVICGWADGYTEAAMRMATRLNPQSRVWIGPWAHTYPHLARPGPQGGFLQEALRWWDHWLKGRDNGVERQPRMRLYLQDSAPPQTSYDQRPGRWLGFDCWPPTGLRVESWSVRQGCLVTAAGDVDTDAAVLSLCTPLSNSIHGPEWLPHGIGPELPPDQAGEDAGSLCFDSEILSGPIELCGAPQLSLRCRADCTGLIQVRLVDLRPDGSASRITWGVLNLHHRRSLARPRAMAAEKWELVSFSLDNIAQRVPAGHRLRLALSTQAWPLVWPAARNMRLEVATGSIRLDLPLLDRSHGQRGDAVEAGPAQTPPPLEMSWLRPVSRQRIVKSDRGTGWTERRYIKDDGAFRIAEHGMLLDAMGSLTYRSRDDDPLSAEAVYHYRIRHSRDQWDAGVVCDLQVRSDAHRFLVDGEFRAMEEGRVIRQRPVALRIPRRWV